MRRLLPLSALLGAALLLGGCSGMRLVESSVRATPTAAAGSIESGARYRFERLPSQLDQAETDSVEAIAEAELAEVGLVHDEAAPRYSVQVTARMQAFVVDDWGRPYDGGRVGTSIIFGTGVYGTRPAPPTKAPGTTATTSCAPRWPRR